jgi:hypothetical protein
VVVCDIADVSEIHATSVYTLALKMEAGCTSETSATSTRCMKPKSRISTHATSCPFYSYAANPSQGHSPNFVFQTSSFITFLPQHLWLFLVLLQNVRLPKTHGQSYYGSDLSTLRKGGRVGFKTCLHCRRTSVGIS